MAGRKNGVYIEPRRRYWRRTMIWIVWSLQGNTSTIQEPSSTKPAKFVSRGAEYSRRTMGFKGTFTVRCTSRLEDTRIWCLTSRCSTVTQRPYHTNSTSATEAATFDASHAIYCVGMCRDALSPQTNVVQTSAEPIRRNVNHSIAPALLSLAPERTLPRMLYSLPFQV
jgi:hypothetical protein